MGFICQNCHINDGKPYYVDNVFMILCNECKLKFENSDKYTNIIPEDDYYRNTDKRGIL